MMEGTISIASERDFFPVLVIEEEQCCQAAE
jgi:hypothetical protein